ncbi:DinB family protein [Deinococcus sp. KNUC1210]|uniref:DinB family protein n=1 Tax=Deinococcus sp. KNUC1210 TaxID=2917691 RepID=UPI001EF0EA47|nr:DinB family protein [Deinococcus sp. KNUC1210]ULH14690.1 DinB family protein [Deinococcus sp. KNUC1210]
MTTLQAFLAEQYAAEISVFRGSLDSFSDAEFSAEALGHTPAWHALHIADWLRLTVLEDRTPTYHFLGWEDKAWVGPLGTQAAPLVEAAGKAAVLARLDSVSAQVLTRLHALTPDDLNGMIFSPSAPTGERPRLTALGLHLRHIAYHRGQLQLLKKVPA